ncbi:MAG: hypothetical protein VX730_04400 [Pseudomonadota bacterium]|nr:hypothetical protein [Pseudomonadota bacterium]
MRYSLLVVLFAVVGCAKVDAPPLYTVPEIPEDKPTATVDGDSVSQDEISDIIKKREQLLSTGE